MILKAIFCGFDSPDFSTIWSVQIFCFKIKVKTDIPDSSQLEENWNRIGPEAIAFGLKTEENLTRTRNKIMVPNRKRNGRELQDLRTTLGM